MPKITKSKHANGTPAETEEVKDGHTINEFLDDQGKLLKKTDKSRPTGASVTVTETYDPPGKLTEKKTERVSVSDDVVTETTEIEDGAKKKVSRTVKKTGPLTPPKKGIRETTTEYIYVGGVAKKVKETTVTKQKKADDTFEPEEKTEVEYDPANGKMKKKVEVKLDRDTDGNVIGRTTTTTDYDKDGKPTSDGGRKEKYDPATDTFSMLSVSLTVYLADATPPKREPRRGPRRRLT